MAPTYQYVRFRAEVYKEEDLFVAACPDFDVSSFGTTVEEAKESLREAVEEFMKGCQDLGTLVGVLKEAGFRQQDDSWLAREPMEQTMGQAKLVMVA